MLKSSAHDYSVVLHWTDITTSIYLSLFVVVLYYNNLLVQLGHYECIHLLLLLALAEIAKYVVCLNCCKSVFHRSSLKDVFKTSSVLVSTFVVIYVLALLFGAPVLSQMEQTVMFALLQTIVTALPLCLHLGPDHALNVFLSITSNQKGESIYEFYMLKVRLSLLGTWLGATVIPLDWNRPWQIWPIPCSVGVIFGYTVANCVTSIIQFSQRQHRPSNKTGKYTL